MGERGFPYASSPHSPHEEHPFKGVNPLRRTSDMIESWFFRFLMLVLALGLPVASISAGLTAYESSMRVVQAQSAERHEITARVTSDAEGARDGADTDDAPPIGWLVGGMTAVAVAAGVFATRAGMRLLPDRRSYTQCDAEWDLVEPSWSARFRH